jgi:carbon-monoxide dehydrogenase medium subunit
MSELKYLKPQSLNEILVLLSEYKAQACLIAGGTDLIAKKKRGIDLPPVVINIQEVQELNYIKYDVNTGLKLGALSPMASIENSSIIKSGFPVLADAANMMASPAVRLQATIGGNLCNAAPSADTAPALIVLGGGLKISSRDGDRIVSVEDFFAGPGKTVLITGEILSEIQIPPLPTRSAAVYLKQKRREGADLAVVGVAAFVAIDAPDSTIQDIRIALGAVAPTPLRAREAENIIKGKKLNEDNLKQASKAACHICAPISDSRGSAEYRIKMIEVLVPRAIQQAVTQIRPEA